MTKTFFLGLGGQKCGSSWIQAYLARQPGSDFGRLGEYQAWEHRLGGVFARYRVAQPTRGQRLRARFKMALGRSEPAQHLRWRLQEDPETYFDYFARLCDQPGIIRTGDVTPSYAALPPELLAALRDGLIRRGFEVRVIFAMRDPVARLVSHLRMDTEKGRLPEQASPEEALRAFYKTDEAQARSQYERTLASMAAVFAPHERHICLFEDLFTPDGIEALSAFARVSADPSAGTTKVNARGSASKLSKDLEAEIARHYAPAYHAAHARLPKVAQLWPSARHVLTNA